MIRSYSVFLCGGPGLDGFARGCARPNRAVQEPQPNGYRDHSALADASLLFQVPQEMKCWALRPPCRTANTRRFLAFNTRSVVMNRPMFAVVP